jgi:TnpA family transposase
MPVSFLSARQRENYGRYAGSPTADELTRFFHLTDNDLAQIMACRGAHNRMGFALQLTTVRYLGTFLDNPLAVPAPVLETLARQLRITDLDGLKAYLAGERRWDHVASIRAYYGYSDITEPRVGFRLSRWLFALCWTGTDQPSALFDRATAWLLAHKILLPGCSTLERFVLRLRTRVEARLWRLLGQGLTVAQQARLQDLLAVQEGSRTSLLDQLRSGPTRISSPALRGAIERLRSVRELGITLPTAARIPSSRIAALARFANRAKAQAISRMPAAKKMATLAAFVHCLEATAQDDVLEVLEMLLHELFGDAEKADQKARLRTLKDLDRAATALADACRLLLDPSLPDDGLREKLFEKIPRAVLERALENVTALTRPPDNVYYLELARRHRAVKGYLPSVLTHLRFEAGPAGQPVVAAYDWLRDNLHRRKPANDAPREVIGKAWQRYVVRKDDSLDIRAYTFCVLDRLETALRRRDVFTRPSWRYADPRANLLAEKEWEAMRPVVCRTLGLPPDPEAILEVLTHELDQTYREAAERLPSNPAVRFETVNGKEELILTPLDELEEPPSLIRLRQETAARMPRVDLPDIVLEIATRTGFAEAFTHLTERKARAVDLTTSLCAVLLAEACNTGPEPFVRHDNPALKRDRLAWVKQNYLRDDTVTDANAILVAAQNRIALAHAWGGGEVASADGMRFVVPIRTVHAGPNPKYFGPLKGVTWYNLLSNQITGLNAILVPGTLRDSLIVLAVVLEQQTELRPTQIMTDTGAYSDVVFGLFRLLGYRFCPRLADMGDARFWRIDGQAQYGQLDGISQHKLNLRRIATQWDDMLRLAGSLLLGRVPATGIMRTLQVGDHPTRLAQAVAEFGRIDKTLHMLTMLDDEDQRRGNLLQLNRGEGRHSLARAVFHGKRGELRQRYREGQEDQLGALGLVLNMIVLWNTIYLEAALGQLRKEGYPVKDEDVARLSPLIHHHIHMLGRYFFSMPEAVARGELRPLRDPANDPE